MIKNDGNNEQIYGRNDMVMLNPNNKIYGSLGIADKYVLKTEEGTMLVLNNPKLGSFGDVLTEFNMYGRSEQKKYNGYQLLPLAPINKTTGEKLNLPYTENGITVDIANDGIGYRLYGTNTLDGQEADVYLCMANEFDIEAGTYTRSGKIINGNNNVTIVSGGGLQGGGVFEYREYKLDFAFTETVEKGKSGNFIIRISQNATVNATVYFQIEKGSKAHGFEPYVGGQPSPSPDYPQEIKSVVDPIIKVRGKNLLRYPYAEGNERRNGIVFTDNKDGSISVSGTATGASYYNFHKKVDDKCLTLASGTYKLVVKGRSKCNVVVNNGVVSVKNEGTLTITDGHNEAYAYIMVQEGVTVDETIYPMIQFVSITDESYEPYKEQSIQLPITLNAIPVQSGGNVAIDGQQYISDYVDVARGKLVKRVYEHVFSGADKWAVATDGAQYLSWRSYEKPGIMGSSDGKRCLCSCLIANTFTVTRKGENYISTQFFDDTCRIWVSANVATSKLTGEKVFLALIVPEEISLTQEEIREFKELVTYYPVTNIGNDYNTWMKATYKSIESV